MIDPLYQITIDETTDVDSSKTPWYLVLNYIHKMNTTPSGNARTVSTGFPVLPLDGSLDFDNINIDGTVPNGSVDYPRTWGHTGNNLFNKTCISIGSSFGNENGLEIRFLAKTSKHTRMIHFKSSDIGFCNDFRYGNVSVSTNNASVQNTLLNGHTAFLPNVANINLYNGSNDSAMTTEPFYTTNTYHWIVGGGFNNRWAVDDNTTSDENTYHQIWVRANKP